MRAWYWMMVFVVMSSGISACGNSNATDGGTDGGMECSNGVVEGSEECDDGADNSDTTPDACRTDCTNPICGDNVVDTGEQCDDGNTDDGDGCDFECFVEGECGDGLVQGREECEPGIDENCQPVGHVGPSGDLNECTFARTAFRMTELALVDPGFYVGGGAGCGSNLSSIVNDGLTVSVNGDRASDFAPPDALDGLVDLGFVFTTAPLRQGDGETSNGEFVLSDCTLIPFNASPCAPTVNQEPFSVDFSLASQTSGTCLEALEGTTGPGLVPPIRTVEAGEGACWVSQPFEWTLALGSIAQIPLLNVQVASEWGMLDLGELGSFHTMERGLIRGFLTREAGDQIIIELLGFITDTLSNILSPPTDPVNPSCEHSDTGPNGEDGWWLYLHFSATEMPWEGGPLCGNGVIDLDVPVGVGTRDEMCDPGIETGNEGACAPLIAGCVDDGPGCIDRTVNAGDPCAPTCFERTIVENVAGDGCCPDEEPGDPDCT